MCLAFVLCYGEEVEDGILSVGCALKGKRGWGQEKSLGEDERIAVGKRAFMVLDLDNLGPFFLFFELHRELCTDPEGKVVPSLPGVPTRYSVPVYQS